MATGVESRHPGARLLPAAAGPHRAPDGRRGRLRRLRLEEHRRCPGGRHPDRCGPARRRAPARLQDRPAARLRRHLPDARRRVPAPARRAREAAPQRRHRFVYEPESSVALGFGYRCGFLGLLHMEIVQERLEREFGLELIASAPSVEYHVKQLHKAEEVVVDNPAQFPPAGEVEGISEPWVLGHGHHPDRLHRPDHGPGHHAARRLHQHGVPRPEAREACTSRCRWPS